MLAQQEEDMGEPNDFMPAQWRAPVCCTSARVLVPAGPRHSGLSNSIVRHHSMTALLGDALITHCLPS